MAKTAKQHLILEEYLQDKASPWILNLPRNRHVKSISLSIFLITVKCYHGEVVWMNNNMHFLRQASFKYQFQTSTRLASHEFLSLGFLVLYSTANYPKVDRKWSPLSTSSDPVKSRGLEYCFRHGWWMCWEFAHRVEQWINKTVSFGIFFFSFCYSSIWWFVAVKI